MIPIPRERNTAFLRKISAVKPCPTFISRWFISRRATTKSNRGARRFFPSLGFFLVFADRGNWSAILFLSFFFFSFFFFCRATRSRTIYNKESVWIGSGEFFLRPAFRRRSQSALEPWENRIESRVKEDGKRESGGSPARREKSHGRRIGGLVKFIRNGFRFEWNVRRVDYFIGAEKKKKEETFLERGDCEIIEGKLRSDEGETEEVM